MSCVYIMIAASIAIGVGTKSFLVGVGVLLAISQFDGGMNEGYYRE